MRRKGASLQDIANLVHNSHDSDAQNSRLNPVTGCLKERKNICKHDQCQDSNCVENSSSPQDHEVLTLEERELREKELNEFFDSLEALGVTAIPVQKSDNQS